MGHFGQDLSVSHPLMLWDLRARPALRARDLTPRMRKATVTLVGWAITRKDVQAVYDTDRSGSLLPQIRIEDMSFVTLEDETGLIETTWFSETYRSFAVLLERGTPLLITGTVEVDHGVVSVIIRHVKQISAR